MGLRGPVALAALALVAATCQPAPAEWEVVVDPAEPGAPLSRALLGHYDLSGALFGYDAVPGLAAALADAGFAGADWRIGLGRWEGGTRLLPALSDGTPCPLPTAAAAAPPGASDLDLIASRDWFTDDGAPVALADTAADARYALGYARSVIDVAVAFGARPFLSVDLMPRALAASRAPRRGDCGWTFTNRVSNVRPADPDVFAAALAGAVRRLVEGDGTEPGRPVRYVELWNEPELPLFWDRTFEDGRGALDRFFSMAVPSLVGLDAWRASSGRPEVKAMRFGLASFASASTAARAIVGLDAVTLPNGAPVPLDFVSFHAYDDDPLAVVGAVERVARAARASHRYRKVELVLAEWGPELAARSADPAYARSMAPALHVGTVLSLGAAAGLDRAHHAILWDFYPGGLVELGIVGHDGAPKPAQAAYALLAQVITGDAVRLTPRGHPDGRLPGDGAVLVSRAADGRVRMLFTNRGSAPRSVRAHRGDGMGPGELRIFSDPAEGIVTRVPVGPRFAVPANSLVLAIF